MGNLTVDHEPRKYLFTCEEYYAMGELGLFAEQRVELIDGEIIEMSPHTTRHSNRVCRANALFAKLLPPGFILRPQLPMHLGPRSEPEPDLAIVKGAFADFENHHPTTAELVIEIGLSSLKYDRTTKASLYARAGCAEFWLVNLLNDTVEVYRNPVKGDGSPFGFKYAMCKIVNCGESVSPLFLPGVTIAAKELLP